MADHYFDLEVGKTDSTPMAGDHPEQHNLITGAVDALDARVTQVEKGIPDGGSENQLLAKKSGSNQDTKWMSVKVPELPDADAVGKWLKATSEGNMAWTALPPGDFADAVKKGPTGGMNNNKNKVLTGTGGGATWSKLATPEALAVPSGAEEGWILTLNADEEPEWMVPDETLPPYGENAGTTIGQVLTLEDMGDGTQVASWLDPATTAQLPDPPTGLEVGQTANYFMPSVWVSETGADPITWLSVADTIFEMPDPNGLGVSAPWVLTTYWDPNNLENRAAWLPQRVPDPELETDGYVLTVASGLATWAAPAAAGPEHVASVDPPSDLDGRANGTVYMKYTA